MLDSSASRIPIIGAAPTPRQDKIDAFTCQPQPGGFGLAGASVPPINAPLVPAVAAPPARPGVPWRDSPRDLHPRQPESPSCAAPHVRMVVAVVVRLAQIPVEPADA